MKTLILDGLEHSNEISAFIRKDLRLKGLEAERALLSRMTIAPCRGCFQCWVRTPGVCVIDDDGRKVTEAAMKSDIIVMLTKITFGGYSSHLKKAADRFLPILSPFFMKIGGEVHHRRRYTRYPAMIGIGIQEADDPESAALFSLIIQRHALNIHCPWHMAFTMTETEAEEKIRSITRSISLRAKEAA
jgi:multimeric flavodoxin WrbA